RTARQPDARDLTGHRPAGAFGRRRQQGLPEPKPGGLVADLSGVWRYDTSTVIAAPASGYLRSGPAPVSQLAIAGHTWGGADGGAELLALTSGAQLLCQEVSDATMASKFMLAAAPIDHVSWVEYAVTEVVT